jgi:aryl-alcohol dehydrogenase-like predicted oxidoreductase
MHYTRLGRTGLKVSRICLGAMNFGWSADEQTSFDILNAALAHGINFIDTADIYSFWVAGNRGGESEAILGKWLANQNRRDLVIATKCRIRMDGGKNINAEGLSRHHIIHSVEDSLRRLRTEYIDLYQAHAFDAETPIDETLYAFDHLVKSGKVLYVGASNYPAWRLMESLWAADSHGTVRYDSLQPHYSLFHRDEYERDLADVCGKYGIGVIPYSPLAAGFATGKYRRDDPAQIETARADSGLIRRLIDDPQAWDALDLMTHIAAAHGCSVAHVALAWMLHKPTITAPIIGARTVRQLDELVGAVNVRLSAEEIGRLDAATDGFGRGERHRV